MLICTTSVAVSSTFQRLINRSSSIVRICVKPFPSSTLILGRKQDLTTKNQNSHTLENTLQQYTKMSISQMRRGMGGRIEEAFASAKENGRAAFVSFVTAGYPSAEGECCGTRVTENSNYCMQNRYQTITFYMSPLTVCVLHRHSIHPFGHARGRIIRY